MEKRGSRYYAINPATGKKQSTRAKTAAGAMARLAEWERAAIDPSYNDAASKTLAHGFALVLEAKRRQDRAEGTMSMYDQKGAQLARILGQHRPLAAITAEVIDAYIERRRQEGVIPHTIHKELAVLRQILKACKRRGWFRQEVERVMPVGMSPKYEPKKEFLPREQWPLLLDGGVVNKPPIPHDSSITRIDDKSYHVGPMQPHRAAVIAFMLAVGANLSETFRARPEHINLKKGDVYIDGTKRETRRRWVPINSMNRELLERVLRDGNKSGLLFEEWGKIHRDLSDRCEKLGLPHLSPNDLRRTYGSILVQANVPFEIVAKLMGHSSVSMVFKTYGQLRPTHLQSIVGQYIQ